MEVPKKCSHKKHSEFNAISYCTECNLYLCNKCVNMHTEYLETHHLINLDKSNQEIFSGLCQEVGHKDKLEYYCKNHNKLCCSACISKIKENGKGEHHDCEICSIKEIKEEKKNKLNENLKNLEEYSKNIEGSIKELKNIFEKMNENKEEIKLKISNIFTKIRNAINEREEQLLKEVDIIYDNEYFKEDIIKKAEKIPNKIINLMKKGNKIINNGWDDDNSLFAKINDCIIIENNLKNIIEINKNIDNSKKINISFIPENEESIEIIKNIKKFGKINSFQDEELDEEGLEEEAILTVVQEGKCTRKEAIKALRSHNGDPVEALLDIIN